MCPVQGIVVTGLFILLLIVIVITVTAPHFRDPDHERKIVWRIASLKRIGRMILVLAMMAVFDVIYHSWWFYYGR